MRRSIFLGAVALLAAVACNKEAQAPVAVPEGRQVVVSAQKEQDTKVFYQNDATFCWGKTETIGIYTYSVDPSSSYTPWIAPFSLAEGGGTNHGKFTATLESDIDYGYVAIYPNEPQTVFVDQQEIYMESIYDPDKGELGFFLPPYYRNLEDSQDGIFAARMPMAAKLDMSGDKGSLAFKNVGGLVKVKLTDLPSNARYFKLWAKSGGNISGMFSIKVDDIGTEYLASEGHSNTVELQLAAGAQASSTMELYFPVPCGTFVFGIGVYSDEGIILEKDGSASNTISRGTILRMPAVSVNEQPVNPTDPGDAGYFLIGEFGSHMWDLDVVLQAVPGNSDWFVARNIASSPNGLIAFKFRADADWSSELGAAENYDKELNTKIRMKASPSSDVVLRGTGSYDVYLSPIEELCFILTAGSSFAVPSNYEQKPAYNPATDVVVYADNQTSWGSNLRLYLWGTVNNLGGAWPGIESDATAVFGNTTYMRFVIPGALGKNYEENLIFNNNGSGQLADLAITLTNDAYFIKVTDSGATLLADPR